jgi:hypothetical protein
VLKEAVRAAGQPLRSWPRVAIATDLVAGHADLAA